MIRDLSQTLYSILTQPGLPPELAAAQVVFDRPTDTFQPGQTSVDLFLYDIRENLELRNNEPTILRQNGTATIAPAPLRVACSYVATAWPHGGTDVALQEHRLLSQVLMVLAGYSTIPSQFLQGSLKTQQPPMPMITAQADGLRSPGDFWTALGAKLHASINLTVTLSMSVLKATTAPVVITQEVRFGERTSPLEEAIIPATLQDSFRVGGTVVDNKAVPVANASVLLVELGYSTNTDPTGDYVLDMVPPGAYTLRITPGGGSPQNFVITVPAPGGKIPPANYNVKLA